MSVELQIYNYIAYIIDPLTCTIFTSALFCGTKPQRWPGPPHSWGF